MATIRVKCGGCGIHYTDANGNKRHALKTPESGPFECDDDQADRLVGLGVAEYVGLQWRAVALEVADEESALPPETQQDELNEPAESPEIQQAEPDEPAEATGKRTGHLIAEDLENMSYLELKHLAAEMGIFPDSKKKSDYIAALVAAEVEIDDEDNDDELPELCAADPE